MQDQPATLAFAALGYSLAYEDLKGDFESARRCVQSWLVQSHQSADPLWQADALIWRAVVHILQGELLPAETCLDGAKQRAAGDANRSLRIVTYRLLTMYERYNTFPDFDGAAATEISARWRGAEDMRQADARWHDLVKRATDANVQDETWIVYGFFCNLKSARAMLEGSRFAPSADVNRQVLQHSLNRHELQLGTAKVAILNRAL